jgi:hypothetical protein
VVPGAIRQVAQVTGTISNIYWRLPRSNPAASRCPNFGGARVHLVERRDLAGSERQSDPERRSPMAGTPQPSFSRCQAVARSAIWRCETAILRLRNDPTANAVMAGAFTRANSAFLSVRLGRSPSEGELRIAHLLGAGGAAPDFGR